MQGPVFEDRRMFLRFSVRLRSHYVNLRLHQDQDAEVCNISPAGIGFIVNEELSVDTPLDIEVSVLNGESFHAQGKVIWIKKLYTNKYRIGVSLDAVDLVGVSRLLNAEKISHPASSF